MNLDKLYNTLRILESEGSWGRGFGKTTYSLYNVLGYLQILEKETIIILIDNEKCLNFYLNQLRDLFEKNELDWEFDGMSRRFKFKNNSNNIKIFTLNTIQKMHPIDTGASRNLYLITDLNNMPPEFYQEEITVEECYKLEKYKNYFNGL
jgi:hypothetical protein